MRWQRLAIHYDRIRSLSVAAVKDHKIIEDHKTAGQYGAAIKKRPQRQWISI